MVQRFLSSLEYRDNRYFVELPWKDNIDQVPSNSNIALAILNRTYKKVKISGLLDAYNSTFQQQLADGIIEQIFVHPSQYNDFIWIPHRPVVKTAEQATTKVRAVFNCSFKTKDSYSLNQAIYPGINLINDLLSLLLRFRTNKYVILADLKQAFLQIRLKLPDDKNRFAFFWYQNGQLVTYRYTSLVFGLSASPFILNQIIKHHSYQFPQDFIAEIMRENFYVDNLIYTHNDLSTLSTVFHELGTRMSLAGFDVRSWNSNNSDLRSQFDTKHKLADHGLSIEKVLGYNFDISTDQMCVNKTSLSNNATTKRQILSEVSKVYDPLSLYAPITIKSKIFLQHLWEQGVNWDEKLPDNILSQWNSLKEDLEQLSVFKFPRFCLDTSLSNASLIIFCDASQVAYGFTAYIVSNNHSQLVFSKYKVAPRPKRSLPTLELLSVFLAMKSLSLLLKTFIKNVKHISIFVDAQIVLAWLHSTENSSTKQIFIKNRVSDIHSIQQNTLKQYNIAINFLYVKTAENPADLATRGLSLSNFKQHLSLWQNGPSWISLSPDQWPQPDLGCLNIETQNKMYNSISAFNIINQPISLFDIERFSSFNKLHRVAQYVFNFIHRCRKSFKQYSPDDIKLFFIKQMQQQGFPQEITYLKKDPKTLSKIPIPSRVYKLNLFLDTQGVLRSKGRLGRNQSISYAINNPIMLDRKSRYTTLLIETLHEECYHLGLQTTLARLRNKGFWVCHGRQTVKSVIANCITCKKYNQIAFSYPRFTNMSVSQVHLFRPYQYTGVDYTGHFTLTTPDGEQTKYYILLFTCMTIRAIHLELVSDMSALNFLNAFKRFCNLYGTPTHLYSDNAKSFIVAGELLSNITQTEEFSEYLRKFSIKHIRIPVYSAWIGSSWERMIKTVKACLYKAIGRSQISFDEMSTLLSSIQYAINSRPLTYTSLDDNIVPLSPNNFIRPHANNNISFIPTEENILPQQTTVDSLRDTLSYQQRIYNKFKKQWYEHYLIDLREQHLQFHNKEWTNRIRKGDIVLIRNSLKPRPFWHMGKVVDLIIGDDGCIRSAKVQGPDKRIVLYSINYLYPLELSISHNGSSANSEPSSILSQPVDKQLDSLSNSIQPVDNPHKRSQRKSAQRCREFIKNRLEYL